MPQNRNDSGRRPDRYGTKSREGTNKNHARATGGNRDERRPSRGPVPSFMKNGLSRPGSSHPMPFESGPRRPGKNHVGHTDRPTYAVPDASMEKTVSMESSIPMDANSIHGEIPDAAVIGRNAVRELLKAERSVDKIYVQKGEREGSIVMLVAMAEERGIPVLETEKAKLDEMSGFVPHQGIIAMAAEKEYVTVDEILEIAKEKGEKPLLVLCNGVTDPYNLGAVIRCAEGAGAHGVIIPKRRAVGLTPLVNKASAGALEHMAVAKVSNLSQTIRELKEKGLWVYAAEAGGRSYDELDYTVGCAIVMGSEGSGVGDLVKKTSDEIVSIPMYGEVNSFNVSTAAAVILCEAARQRHKS